MKKKPKKKLSKKKTAIKKPAKKAAKKIVKKAPKPIGRVTHFFGKIKVAIVKFNTKVKTGTTIHFKGATTDFKDTLKSMQYDHKAITVAPKGKQVGVKVKKRVREGDDVFVAE